VGAELFSSEVFGMPLFYVVYRLEEEMFMPIYFHGALWYVDGVLWVRDVVSCGDRWALCGFCCVEWGAR
jgi:hypothetical protein